MDNSAFEAPLVQELEVCAHIVGKGALATTHDHRMDEQMALVDEAARELASVVAEGVEAGREAADLNTS